MNFFKRFSITIFFIFIVFNSFSQKADIKKYPSLFWEITGNKLKKPSYLFGTMHISNKMVFHLSDSFFTAIKNCDIVGLELNSETWQQEMMEMEKQRNSFYRFYSYNKNNNQYSKNENSLVKTNFEINEYSFKATMSYIDLIKSALQETPYIINSLLYRTKEYGQDFEENTFLDMYIYQTGKKLGKKSAGMETIFSMEKYTNEATIAKENEKRKEKNISRDDLPEMSADEAYRKGDLDMLDSIDRMTNESEAFTEKFLYQRNSVQSYSMDTIMQKGQSLFVGVGAAHLPGKRGVIELLRKMGYKLRPIKMIDRDAVQREKIDKIKVPVKFIENVAADSFYKVKVPGKLYEKMQTLPGMFMQYADMSNGAYYMVTRMPTLSNYYNISSKEVFQKIDSLLYENIPGKIIKKTTITKNGYQGFDITNKTRRGDLQRYNILITPFEVVIFKMSGNENYVDGDEAKEFFSSIYLKPTETNINYENFVGTNFQVQIPKNKYYQNFYGNEILFAKDNNKNISFQIQKRIFDDLSLDPNDSFKLKLMEESFIGSNSNTKLISSNFEANKPFTELNCFYSVKDSFISSKYIANGNQLFLISAKAKNKIDLIDNLVLKSFKLVPVQSSNSRLYIDTFLKFSVQTPFLPIIADSLKSLYIKLNSSNSYNNEEPFYKTTIDSRVINFYDEKTGANIIVTMSSDGKYEYENDSLYKRKLYRDSLEKEFKNPSKLANYLDSVFQLKYPLEYKDRFKKTYIVKKNELERIDGFSIHKIDYTQKGSTKLIKSMELYKDNINFQVITSTDTSNSNEFVNEFFKTFKPLNKLIETTNIFGSKVNVFFKDYYSSDTITKRIAQSAITRFEFKKNDLPKMIEAYNKIPITEKGYFNIKSNWISAIATIKDSTIINDKINFLKYAYEKTIDTSAFQNTVLENLIYLNTKNSYALFKKYLIQDPPIISSNKYEGDEANYFSSMDSLELAKTLFPEILQLASIEDYKNDINNLLLKLVDSNKIAAREYETYSAKILFDAKIALKKQRLEDEKNVKNDNENDDVSNKIKMGLSAITKVTNNRYGSNTNYDEIMNYTNLLLPFYETNPAVPNFINKIWTTKDANLKYNLMLKLIEKNKKIPDTIIMFFAKNETDRGDLYYKLSKLNKINLFPSQYLNQQEMAKSFLYTAIDKKDQLDSIDIKEEKIMNSNDFSDTYRDNYDYENSEQTTKLDSVFLIKKENCTIHNKTGIIYVFKYRKDKLEKWRFAFSGLQPINDKEISYKNYLTTLTDTKINDDEPIDDQINKELKKIKYKKNFFTKNFYQVSNNYYNKNYD